jgi:peptidoglycan/xylan/chitin deacetylase (PgdA/CDA1 family)
MSLKNPVDSRLYRVPNFVSWFYPKRIWSIKNSDAVYLTFDDGPHPETTPWLLNLLKENEIKATFFFLGEQAEKYPELAIQVMEEGHSIGHHGYEHISPKKQSLSDFKLNLDKSQSIVSSNLYRPPYGEIKRSQAKYVLENGRLVMWNWMSYDWDDRLPVQQIIDRFKKDLNKGDIAVFHENEKSKQRLKEIIPEIIGIVRNKGLNFAALDKN